jgi:hypothetical protein
MITIDLDRIRKALPNRAEVKLTKYNGRTIGKGDPCIECFIPKTSLSEKDFEMCKQWQREILGEALSEFYTEETGRLWYVFLKRIHLEFINVEYKDINSFTGLTLLDKKGIIEK